VGCSGYVPGTPEGGGEMDFVVYISVPATVTAVTLFVCKALPLLSDRVNKRARKLERAKRK
jgi:hypothetical protein